jgi:hypothetical protein
MTHSVKMVNDERSLGKELGLAQHAIRPQSARKIVHNTLRRDWPTSDHRGKHIVAAFARGDAVKSVADAVLAPTHHDATGEPLLTVL